MKLRTATALLLLATVFNGPTAVAATGQVITLPLPRVKVKSGLRLSVDPRWVSGAGYRPVRVRIAPITGGAVLAERFIEVQIRPHGWYHGDKAGAVSATVHLPQGATYGEAIINIPQTNGWNSFDIESYEGNHLLTDLEGESLGFATRYYYESTDGTPAILILHHMAPNWSPGPRVPSTAVVITPKMVPCAGGVSFQPLLCPTVAVANQPGLGKELKLLPDIRVLAGRFPQSYYNGYLTADRFFATTAVTDADTMRLVNDLPFMDIVEPNALPEDWLSYSGVDVLITSFAELRNMSSQFPAKWHALRTWLSTGTTMCVYGVGQDFERLSQLAELLEMEPALPSADDNLMGWNKPNPSNYRQEIKTLENLNGSVNWWQQQANMQRQAIQGGTVITPKPPKTLPFVYRPVGQGQVVAIAAEDPFPGTEHDWGWIFNTIPSRNWLWYQRHGLSFQRENRHFWNFLIADIGRAPVMSFLALITLFAVVIGPVNYFFLQRRGRLYLLLVTVPAGALVVTGGLFLYATFADGLGVRARVRSFTDIDQRRGRAISWSRQMYYAGLAPSRGLTFPADAAVYPIDHQPVSGFGMEDNSRHLVWGEQQYLVAGYFISRTPSQMLVVEPRETAASLRFIEAAEDQPPRVTNNLGVAATRLLVRDSAGQHFLAENLRQGASTTLRATNIVDEAKHWRGVFGANRLSYPEGFNPANLENVSGIFGPGFRYQGQIPAVSVDTSILESSLRQTLSTDFNWLQPRSYAVLTTRPPLVSLGVDSAEETAGFHVIVGRW